MRWCAKEAIGKKITTHDKERNGVLLPQHTLIISLNSNCLSSLSLSVSHAHFSLFSSPSNLFSVSLSLTHTPPEIIPSSLYLFFESLQNSTSSPCLSEQQQHVVATVRENEEPNRRSLDYLGLGFKAVSRKHCILSRILISI